MEHYSDFEEAGKVCSKAKAFGLSLLKENASVLEIAEKVEKFIIDSGCELAFPVNVSINDIAAHYNPIVNDSLKLKKGDLVKLDLGAHKNGAVGDCAVSASIGKSELNEKLIEAAKKACYSALKMARPGVSTSEIGAEIQRIIESFNFKPIKNLSGHGVGRYIIHSDPTIPNYKTKDGYVLKKGDIIAIEPFATNGEGMIYESKGSEIYAVVAKKQTRNFREVLEFINQNFKTLPFAKRHIANQFSPMKAHMSLASFKIQGIIHEYAMLKEQASGKVAQWENTVIVDETPKVITE